MDENLKEYVARRVDEILGEKESKGTFPLLATENEILKEIRQDILSCMRGLYKEGRYKGTRTLNGPALMRKG